MQKKVTVNYRGKKERTFELYLNNQAEIVRKRTVYSIENLCGKSLEIHPNSTEKQRLS